MDQTPDNALADLFRLSEYQKKGLKKLGLKTAHDLLRHFPSRYITVSDVRRIEELSEGDRAILYGTVSELQTKKAYRKKIPMATGVLEDETGSIDLVWFNQPYIAKMLKDGSQVKLEGKVAKRKPASRRGANASRGGGKLYISNPEYEVVDALPYSDGSLFDKELKESFSIPVYPEARGITSKWMYHSIKKLLAADTHKQMEDPIPANILREYNLPPLETALVWIHTPKKKNDSGAARKRFAFEEIFFIQIRKQQLRKYYEAEQSFVVNKSLEDIEEFIDKFPFELTKAQTRSIEEILDDFSSPHAMSRLLEGDVGSGKTAVAAATTYAIATSRPEGQDFGNLQTAYMVPTEILAKQHFESFINYFEEYPINIGLITSSGCRKFPSKVSYEDYTTISRTQLLKWVKNGEIPILIGTHSLIQKAVEFENLAYVIIDEQHRFGIKQRKELTKTGGPLPHLLSMTATPIPRTLALTIYGDLDLTLLDEYPKGRKWPKTALIPPSKRSRVYEKVREHLDKGEQLYVICPRIDEPDPEKERAFYAKSVKAEMRRLQKTELKDYEVAMLHGQMKRDKKEEAMKAFADGEIDALVATSVIEVGVNVPQATMIIIEGAERFGLAQLHQLRGRVMRSTHQPYCYIFTDSNSKKTKDRLRALVDAKSGFELAEKDLKIRGPGELVGVRQSGISDIGMEAIKNIKMVEAARNEARKLVEKDSELKDHLAVKKEMERRHQALHLE